MSNISIDPFYLYWGKPIPISQDLKVYPLTLNEIANLGYKTYNDILGVFVINQENLENANILKKTNQNISKYDLITDLSGINTDFQKNVEKTLSLLLHEKVLFVQDLFLINRDEKSVIIDSNLFNEIKDVVYVQYQIGDSQKKKVDYTSKQKELLAMMDQIKSKKMKGQSDQSIDLLDIISIVSSFSNGYTYENIGKLTVYTLYDVYQRLFNWDDYHIGIQLLPYSSEKTPKLKHWNTKLNKIH
jgi:hypothetical protein